MSLWEQNSALHVLGSIGARLPLEGREAAFLDPPGVGVGIIASGASLATRPKSGSPDFRARGAAPSWNIAFCYDGKAR